MNRFIKHMCEIDKVAARNFFRSHLAGAITKPLFAIPEDQGRYNITLAKRAIPLPKYQGSDITVPIRIEVAWAIVIGRTVESSDVVVAPLSSGRSAPVPDIENLIGPTFTQTPIRININPNQTIQSLLRSVNDFHIAAIPYEHLGWIQIWEIPEIEYLLKDIIGINILPFLDSATLGSGIGLEMKKSYTSFQLLLM